MSKRFTIVNAIPYVNSRPHVGFALELIQSDTLARYHRAQGEEVVYTTGTDENAVKNVQAAEKAGKPVKEFVDEHAEVFHKLNAALNISADEFIRTTEERHVIGAQKLWKACDAAGDIYKKSYQGLYCVGCEQFYTPKELVDGLCPEHKTKPELIEEENYFFRLSKYQDKLLQLLESDEIKITPSSRKNELVQFIKEGLEDFSISRSNARAKNWGISVPGDDSQRVYVWFDALTNYINALGYGTDEKKFETWWNDSYRTHMIGKGIGRFHAIYWPAMLLSAGVALPNEIFVHGYVTVDGEKISKTLGNVIDPFEVVQKYGVDPLRYYLLREIPSSGDGDFSYAKLEARYTGDLANNLGNLVSRVNKLAEKIVISNQQIDQSVQEKIENAKTAYHAAIKQFKLHEALGHLWELFTFGNQYINEKAPWKTGDAVAVASTAHLIQEGAKLLEPFLPETAEKILQGTPGMLFPKL
ncbi:MAG: methionine--tRNA ligase [Patescibacteria group bacterium]